MDNLFLLLVLISPVIFIVSLIKPSLINNLVKKDFSRRQLIVGVTGIFISSFILFGITAPKTVKTEKPQLESKADSEQPQEGQVSEVSEIVIVTPEPSPQFLSTPSPTPIVFESPILKPSPYPTPEVSQPTQTLQSTQSNNCHPSYAGACLDPNASDYDCAGGSGNGPKYTGTVQVVGPDVFDLDRDNDGIGCE